MRRSALISSWLDLFLILSSLAATGYAKYVPFLEPGFFFDYNNETQPVPIPITEQCETIHLKWGRNGAIGPNPVAPYSMVVYTSTFITPFSIAVGSGLSFDWQVPFAPGTQYQICMWDKNGLAGGCQAMYTVIQNSTVVNPTCQNVTFPHPLKVDATVPQGPMSQFGFIDQCTDLFVTPQSGKPPFTLTVAPALHPPYNITSNSMGTIDWTVSLSRAFPFFLSLVSADGQMWSFGPLHAGGFGPSDCLAPGTLSASKAHSLAVGAGFGGAFAAAIVGALAAFLYLRLRHRKPQIDAMDYGPRPFTAKSGYSWATISDVHESQIISPTDIRSPQMTSPAGIRSPQMPSSAGVRSSQITSPSPVVTRSRSSPVISPAVRTRSSRLLSPPVRSSSHISPHPRSRAYVLHHDAGRAPITVITDAAEIVELPPRYRRNSDIVPLPPVREKAERRLPSVRERVTSSASFPRLQR
ncbi:hypothetical protein B0H14DRAFT_2825736 [Mycena olivaceomarginata]|nr:hypothetical protein B0H14DRAFT_2825736 [Mycena olivaceomarginata]